MRKLSISVCLAVLALALPQRTQAEDIGVVKLSDRTPQGKQVRPSGLIGRSSIQLATYLRQDQEVPHPPVESEIAPGPAVEGEFIPDPAPDAVVEPQPVGPVGPGKKPCPQPQAKPCQTAQPCPQAKPCPQPVGPGKPCQTAQCQPCPHCHKVHAQCEESNGIPVCCLPCGVCCLGDICCRTLGLNCHDDDDCEEEGKCFLSKCLDRCNGNGRFGYFCHDGYPCLDPLGHYGMVYPVDPQYFDKRDGQVYAAPHYGIPISVPLAPTVGKTYNYGWGVPSSRLTPVAHSYHWTYGGPVPSTHSTAYPPDYPYDHNYWVPPHDYYRKLPPVKVTAPPQRMAMAQRRLGNPTQVPITHGQPVPAKAPVLPVPDPAPNAPVNVPPAP